MRFYRSEKKRIIIHSLMSGPQTFFYLMKFFEETVLCD